MTELRAEIAQPMTAAPDDVFARLIDVAGLPEWNRHISHVIEAPSTRLVPGVQWVIEMHAMGGRWPSRSTAQTVDRERRVFAHRTQSDDGNPSYALWTWTVAEHDGATRLTVNWDLHPQTFWRRTLMAKIRHRQLRKEVRRSIDTLDHLLTMDRSTVT